MMDLILSFCFGFIVGFALETIIIIYILENRNKK